jgi:hypothetical protein
MRIVWGTLVVLGCLGLGLAGYSANAEQGDKKVDKRVFELRTYYVVPGKMKDMNDRFRNHTNKLLEKHGMTLIGFWQPIDAKESETKLIYLVAHASKEAADKSWKVFRDDPDWIKVKTESEKNGKIVEKVESVFMNPTDYSALK